MYRVGHNLPRSLFIDTGIAQLGEEGIGGRGLRALARMASKMFGIAIDGSETMKQRAL